MPTELPSAARFSDPARQAAYIDNALTSGDPYLVVLALKEVGTVRRVPVALDENPMLSEVLRTFADLGLELRVERSAHPSDAKRSP